MSDPAEPRYLGDPRIAMHVAQCLSEDDEGRVPPKTKMRWEGLTLPAQAAYYRRACIAIMAYERAYEMFGGSSTTNPPLGGE